MRWCVSELVEFTEQYVRCEVHRVGGGPKDHTYNSSIHSFEHARTCIGGDFRGDGLRMDRIREFGAYRQALASARGISREKGPVPIASNNSSRVPVPPTALAIVLWLPRTVVCHSIIKVRIKFIGTSN